MKRVYGVNCSGPADSSNYLLKEEITSIVYVNIFCR